MKSVSGRGTHDVNKRPGTYVNDTHFVKDKRYNREMEDPKIRVVAGEVRTTRSSSTRQSKAATARPVPISVLLTSCSYRGVP